MKGFKLQINTYLDIQPEEFGVHETVSVAKLFGKISSLAETETALTLPGKAAFKLMKLSTFSPTKTAAPTKAQPTPPPKTPAPDPSKTPAPKTPAPDGSTPAPQTPAPKHAPSPTTPAPSSAGSAVPSFIGAALALLFAFARR